LGEMASGLILGLAIAFLNEAFQMAAQTISLQAGFSFASTIDPNTQADSNVLLVLAQLATGLLFFALDIHLRLLHLFSASFDVFSPARTPFGITPLQTVITLGKIMLLTGLKTGLPIVALLILVDLSLALMSRLHAQMQLITITFPAKIVLSFVFVAAIMTRWPTLYERTARSVFEAVSKLVLH
jgi:flagellar biosynthesis protein FliR